MLDKRYANKPKKDGGQMAKKNRKIGTCSTAPPPFGTPTWMIDASFQGKLHNNIITTRSIRILWIAL